jgi:hypothetical protein
MPDHPVPLPILALELPHQSVEALQGIAIVVGLSIVVGCIGYVLYRRGVGGPTGGDAAGDTFTFSDLRRLHGEGQLTDEEYEQAKARLVAMYKAPEPTASANESEQVEDLGHIGGDDDQPSDDAADASASGAGDSAEASENGAGDESPETGDENDHPRSDPDDGDGGDERPR